MTLRPSTSLIHSSGKYLLDNAKLSNDPYIVDRILLTSCEVKEHYILEALNLKTLPIIQYFLFEDVTLHGGHLIEAIKLEAYDIAELLKNGGANLADYPTISAVCRAIRTYNLPMLKYLFKNGAAPYYEYQITAQNFGN